MSQEEHKAEAPERLSCFIVTVSDSRNEDNDLSGDLVKEMLESNFHYIVGAQIVPDEPEKIARILQQASGHPKIQVIILTGGTGISPRDQTYETVSGLYEKELLGFGELFRSLSYSDIGPAAMLSRASAGTINGKIVFSIPGSVTAAKLAMSELILPELPHLVYEVSKGAAPSASASPAG